MSMQRRKFLQTGLAGSTVFAGASLFPQALSADWPKAAFQAKTLDEAMKAILGTTSTADSGEIDIKAPDIAENGAVVPIQVTTALAGVESITLLVKENPVPLVASFSFPGKDGTYISTRIKMGNTSDVTAVVKAGGKLYSAKKEVKVTIGGCGG